jgi:membrane protein DedA with SNARE-associated domain
MLQQLGTVLSGASLWLVLVGLALTELGLPLPETVFIVTAGIVSQRDGIAMSVPIIASCIAVVGGDIALYFVARWFGPQAFQRRPLRWLLPPRLYPRIDALFVRHGSMAIFVARFVSGVRAAAFVLAGMRGMPLRQFILWDGLATVVTVPPFAVIGYLFAHRLVELQSHVELANRYLLWSLAGVIAIYVGVALVRWRRASLGAWRNPPHINR